MSWGQDATYVSGPYTDKNVRRQIRWDSGSLISLTNLHRAIKRHGTRRQPIWASSALSPYMLELGRFISFGKTH